MPDDDIAFPPDEVSELANAVWRTCRRAERDPQTPVSVKIACETVLEQLARMGIILRELVGEPYEEAMKVRVVAFVDSPDGAARIHECLSPAIYFNDQLSRAAEVVVERPENATTDC